jgi:hypothetical protein
MRRPHTAQRLNLLQLPRILLLHRLVLQLQKRRCSWWILRWSRWWTGCTPCRRPTAKGGRRKREPSESLHWLVQLSRVYAGPSCLERWLRDDARSHRKDGGAGKPPKEKAFCPLSDEDLRAAYVPMFRACCNDRTCSAPETLVPLPRRNFAGMPGTRARSRSLTIWTAGLQRAL